MQRLMQRLRAMLRYWVSLRWRALVVLLFFLGGWGFTAGTMYHFREEFFGPSTTETMKGIFLAWSGELVFFSIVGLAITLVSIEKAEDPSKKRLSERIRILLGRADLPDGLFEYVQRTFEWIRSKRKTPSQIHHTRGL